MVEEANLKQDAILDLVINRNRTLNQNFSAVFCSGDTEYNFDFTPYDGALLEVRKRSTDQYKVLTFSTTDGSIVLGIDGQFNLNKEDSELIVRNGQYVYDMYLTTASGDKRAFLSGKFVIVHEVTR